MLALAVVSHLVAPNWSSWKIFPFCVFLWFWVCVSPPGDTSSVAAVAEPLHQVVVQEFRCLLDLGGRRILQLSPKKMALNSFWHVVSLMFCSKSLRNWSQVMVEGIAVLSSCISDETNQQKQEILHMLWRNTLPKIPISFFICICVWNKTFSLQNIKFLVRKSVWIYLQLAH